jgi:hypothetical protein
MHLTSDLRSRGVGLESLTGEIKTGSPTGKLSCLRCISGILNAISFVIRLGRPEISAANPDALQANFGDWNSLSCEHRPRAILTLACETGIDKDHPNC